ncbi:M13 family metallopeptidase [Streptococcus sp. zg-JUN1979]|uniref:M13 family metallopeptidase n=1 Tax=Streptococcus sp. zg-JUN1979 TaxID=3391450 RepID=UPI0039A671FB
MKKKWLGLSVLMVSLLAFVVACGTTKESQSIKTTVETDYYQTINHKWLEKTTIPDDSPVYNVFGEIQDEIDKQLKTDIKDMAAGKRDVTSDDQKELLKLYKQAMNFDQRDKDGVKEAKAYVTDLAKISSFKELATVTKDWILAGNDLPFGFTIGNNPDNTNEKQLELATPSTILPDVSYYEDATQKEQLLNFYKSSVMDVLALYGYKEKEAESMVEKAIAFDALLVPYLPSSEDVSDIKKVINLRTKEEINAYAPEFALGDVLSDLVGQDVATANVSWPKYFEALSQILDDKHFDDYKAWLSVNTLYAQAPYLTEELRQAAGQYALALNGQKELPSKEDAAYDLATSLFSETMSVYYVDHYFSDNAKAQVTDMVASIVDAYKGRLTDNDWLTDNTKQEAITKLDKLQYHIGGPSQISDYTAAITVDETKTLYANLLDISEQALKRSFDDYKKPVDKTLWAMPSYQVNAYYDPASNSIYLPAAILQAPFYDEKQSLAANYGGIGAVIGHEISHAFDSNGSEFDASGNRRDWWTDEDKERFEEKTKAMVTLFDGIQIDGGKVNGALTVTENTADAGGLSVAAQVLQAKDKDTDFKPFFESWATIWRQVATPQVAQQLLVVDVHAPNALRVNVQVKNMDLFYETYDIKESDPMYLAPDKRVRIW